MLRLKVLSVNIFFEHLRKSLSSVSCSAWLRLFSGEKMGKQPSPLSVFYDTTCFVICLYLYIIASPIMLSTLNRSILLNSLDACELQKYC